jgi:hypothetical protein
MPPQFSKINFRYTDARNEKLHSPNVIAEAFVDVQSCIRELLRDDVFIVHAPKGAGKTALGAYYELMAETQWDLFAHIEDLEDFDFSIVRASQDNRAGAENTTSEWKFLLSLRLLALLAEDQVVRADNPLLQTLLKDLEAHGLLPHPDLQKLAAETIGLEGELGFAFIADLKAKLGSSRKKLLKTPHQLSEALLASFERLIPSQSTFLLFIDGLDHVLRRGRDFLPLLGDLFQAVRLINQRLLRTGLGAKIVLLVRDEVARSIPNPDLAKSLSDNGIMLDWYRQMREPLNTDLLAVIANRASMAGFPPDMNYLWKHWFSDHYGHYSTVRWVLSRTRYLPRDLIRFFKALQQFGDPPFTNNTLAQAEREYSQWFHDELADALAGLVDERVRSAMGGIVTELGRRFSIEQLDEALTRRDLANTISANELGSLLFETHWIGNTWCQDNGRQVYIYRARSRSASFSPTLPCSVNLGLFKGLGVPDPSSKQAHGRRAGRSRRESRRSSKGGTRGT